MILILNNPSELLQVRGMLKINIFVKQSLKWLVNVGIYFFPKQGKHIGGITMNCHEDSKGKQGTVKHNPLKHMLHMIICCGLPILLIALLPFIRNLSLSAGNIVAVIAPFLCPMMMISMMFFMMRGNNNKKSCCSGTDHSADEKQ